MQHPTFDTWMWVTWWVPNYIPNFSPIGPAVVPLLRLQYWRFSKIGQLWRVPRAAGDPGALYFAHRTTLSSKMHAIKKTACQSDVPSQSYKRSTAVATAGRPAGRSYLDFSLKLSKNKLRSLRSLARNNGLKINLSKTEFLLLKTRNKKINYISSVTTVLWLAVRLRSSTWLLTRHSPGKSPESHITDC